MSSKETTQPEQGNSSHWLKRALYKLWRFHHTLIISLLVTFAIILLSIRGGALYLESNHQLIDHLIEQQLGQPVAFDKVKINIDVLYPSVSLKNFSIQYEGEGRSRFNFHSASIAIDVFKSILKSQIIIDTLSLDGFYALVRRDKNGEMFLSDIPVKQQENHANNQYKNNEAPIYLKLLNQSNFEISNSEIYFVDETNDLPDLFLSDVNITMRNNNNRHQLTVQSSLNETNVKAEIRLDFEGHIQNIKEWHGKIYANIQGLDHPTLLHLMGESVIQLEEYELDNVDMRLRSWAEIKQGKLQSVQGELQVNDAQLKRLDTKEVVYFNRIEGHFQLQRHTSVPTDWVLELYNINFNIDGKIIADKRIQLHFKNLHQNPALQVYLDRLKIGEFSHVIDFFSPEDLSKTIYQHLKPRGEFNQIKAQVVFKNLDMPIDITDYQLSLDIKNFGVNSFHTLPKIRNLSAHVVLNKDRGRAYINSRDMSVHLDSLFRDAWPVDSLNAEIYWQKMQDTWLLGVKDIDMVNPHLKIQADLKLWFPETGSPMMELAGFYRDANVKYTSYYLPAYIMNPGLVEWLDAAIVSGWGTDGGVVFRGELSQFPFEDKSGTMDIVFNTKDVELDYTPGWPRLKEISSRIQFTEKGMWIESDHSKIFSSVSKNIHASIDDYDTSILKLYGDIKTTIKDGILFLQQSELASEDVTEMLDAQGNIDINLDLVIPTEEGEPQSKVVIKLNNVDYFPPGFERKKGLVSQLNGEVIVHNEEINSKNLKGKIMGRTAQVSIKSTYSNKKQASPDVDLSIDTHVSVNQFKKYKLIPDAILPVTEYISGQTRVNVDVQLPNDHRPLSVSVASGLNGLKSTLPYPLNKMKEQTRHLYLSYKDGLLPEAKLSLNDIIALKVILDNRSEATEIIKGGIHFGSGQAVLPNKKQLTLSGKVPVLPYSQWQAVINQFTKSNISSLTESSQAKNKPKILVPIQLALTELVLPKPELKKEDEKEATKDNNSRVDKTESYQHPQDFPLINGTISSLVIGEHNMGKLSLKTSRIEKSIIFDHVELSGDVLSFTGKGKWHHWNKVPEVDIEGTLIISSFEEFLTMFGYDQLMRGARATVSGYLGWPGDLSSYNKQTIEGMLSIEVEKGAYLEGKPGAAGRVLGLLNMNALARRISLDFSDVSDKGFEFDAIKGEFRVTGGNAYTDNLRVLSPSAKILVTGRVGLVAEDYDERVVVVPEISATLPIAGAAVAGPAGAAVAWVGQKLLGDQLNKVTAMSYTVKGNWYDPVIKKDKLPKNALDNIKNLFGLDKQTESLADENESEPIKH